MLLCQEKVNMLLYLILEHMAPIYTNNIVVNSVRGLWLIGKTERSTIYGSRLISVAQIWRPKIVFK